MALKAVSARAVARIVAGKKTMDGGGVSLKRTIGSSAIPDVDPFLLLDEFKSDDPDDYIAGFPDHPHRGFETVTYMLAGKFEHQDHKGNRGILDAGSVQWMTAGRGIIHSETPLQESGLVWGFQLWVNLPSTHKMIPPRYQDIGPEKIPTVELKSAFGGDKVVAKAKVIAGEVDGISGPVTEIITAPFYIDVEVPKQDKKVVLKHNIPIGHTAFIYAYQNPINIQQGPTELNEADQSISKAHKKTAAEGSLIVFENTKDAEGGDSVLVEIDNTTSDHSTRYILVAGKPIEEPIARRGPFVMNTQQEVMQAYIDFSNGQF